MATMTRREKTGGSRCHRLTNEKVDTLFANADGEDMDVVSDDVHFKAMGKCNA